MSRFGVMNRWLHHIGESHAAVISKQRHPRIEGAGHDGGNQTGTRHHVEIHRAHMLDGCGRGRAPWPTAQSGLSSRADLKMIGTSPAGPHKWGSTICSDEADRNRGVERIAAALEHWPCPRSDAIQCVEVTTPKVPRISGRVVNITLRVRCAFAILEQFLIGEARRFRPTAPQHDLQIHRLVGLIHVAMNDAGRAGNHFPLPQLLAHRRPSSSSMNTTQRTLEHEEDLFHFVRMRRVASGPAAPT